MSHIDKPYSEACEENKEPILEVIRPLLSGAASVLEIGSGTGQHAVHFASALPHLIWQTSDRKSYLSGIRAWLSEAKLPNLPPPIELDVTLTWPPQAFDAVFSANTTHIMSEQEVAAMFSGIAGVLMEGGSFALYGPFNIDGRYTSESNARFDRMLRSQNPAMGIRDLAFLTRLARSNGLALIANHAMPVNNRTLVWRREWPS